ncbi:MAG: hypothetical protein JWP74_2558 [Marmoricola sp.]|nr:hypothetical protein [Marmoricola sp.]
MAPAYENLFAPEPEPDSTPAHRNDERGVIDPIAQASDAIAHDTSVHQKIDHHTMDVAVVPASRRRKSEERQEKSRRAKADRTAARALSRGDKNRTPPAEILVNRMPGISPILAALITGAISGLICVLLVKGASASCDAVRGDGSCGGGFALLALVGILAIEVLIGANLLKAWKVSDPFSTSFLGVGLVATAAMLFFLNVLDSPVMIVVIPVLTAVTFVLSWWVTVTFVEDPDD